MYNDLYILILSVFQLHKKTNFKKQLHPILIFPRTTLKIQILWENSFRLYSKLKLLSSVLHWNILVTKL